jgi:Pyrimidine dimer DNA glycosylase
MRLWTLHPAHLDPQGLVALWREALLARAVLRGLTSGYRHHPQLERFQAHATPCRAISAYLSEVQDEATHRGYRFDRAKVGRVTACARLTVTRGQLEYEWEHLLAKLRRRSPESYRRVRHVSPTPHPSFRVVRGPVASWERALSSIVDS